MNELAVVDKGADWRRLKSLVLDSVSSPITKRVYNLGLDEFFEWYGQEPRPGFTKATVAAWRVSLETRGLGAVSINVRITAVRKLAVEAADNGLLAPELTDDDIIDYKSLHGGLSKERCIEILKECGHLRTGPWFSLVNLHRIPRGLSAQDTERFLREQGKEVCGPRG
jgi:hypothetical protein